MSTGSSAGWHPDPGDPSGSSLRWWDGTQWTVETRPMAGAAGPSVAPPAPSGYPSPPATPAPSGYPSPPATPMTYGLPHNSGQPSSYGQPPGAGQPYGQSSGPGQMPPAQGGMYGRGRGMGRMGGPGGSTFGRRNQASLTAIIVSTIYVVIAITSNIAFFGIFPAFTCFRAFQRREKLAPVAAVFTAAAIAAAIVFHYH